MDACKVVKKYHVAEDANLLAIPGNNVGFVEEGLHDFLKRIKQTKRQAGFLGALRWALKNKSPFEVLLQRLEKCIDALYFATENLDLFEQASLRNAVEIEIESIHDVNVLNSIASSSKSSESNNLISDAASQRITSIRSRQADDNSSALCTFVTADEEQPAQNRLATVQEDSDVAFSGIPEDRTGNYVFLRNVLAGLGTTIVLS
ncbi:hypothetical protein PG994_014315 [Apiospora phragmitis]|uniref:Prion-inhibition and propagation HeLo domain-containing protein n=1 Tax=Apiospora phragmitis TaxID=2905665 RepID=A0ABR1T3Y9_9PEZI